MPLFFSNEQLKFDGTDHEALALVRENDKNKMYLCFNHDIGDDQFIGMQIRDEKTLVDMPLSLTHNNLKQLLRGNFNPKIAGDVQRDCIYISGQSGSGKTTKALELLKLYKKCGMKIYVLTAEKDPRLVEMGVEFLDIDDIVMDYKDEYNQQCAAYEQLKIKAKYLKKQCKNDSQKCKLDMELLKRAPDKNLQQKLDIVGGTNNLYERFNNCVIVFDDFETTSKTNKINFFLYDLLDRSRKHNVCLIISRHKTNEAYKSNKVIDEATDIIVFKKNTPNQIANLLLKYHVPKKEIEFAINTLRETGDNYNFLRYNRITNSFITQKQAWVSDIVSTKCRILNF